MFCFDVCEGDAQLPALYICMCIYIYTYITSHHITSHHITLHYITLHYNTLHYITLHYDRIPGLYLSVGCGVVVIQVPEDLPLDLSETRRNFSPRGARGSVAGHGALGRPCPKRGWKNSLDFPRILPIMAGILAKKQGMSDGDCFFCDISW